MSNTGRRVWDSKHARQAQPTCLPGNSTTSCSCYVACEGDTTQCIVHARLRQTSPVPTPQLTPGASTHPQTSRARPLPAHPPSVPASCLCAAALSCCGRSCARLVGRCHADRCGQPQSAWCRAGTLPGTLRGTLPQRGCSMHPPTAHHPNMPSTAAHAGQSMPVARREALKGSSFRSLYWVTLTGFTAWRGVGRCMSADVQHTACSGRQDGYNPSNWVAHVQGSPGAPPGWSRARRPGSGRAAAPPRRLQCRRLPPAALAAASTGSLPQYGGGEVGVGFEGERSCAGRGLLRAPRL